MGSAVRAAVPVEVDSPVVVVPVEEDSPVVVVPVEEDSPVVVVPVEGNSPDAIVPVEGNSPDVAVPVEGCSVVLSGWAEVGWSSGGRKTSCSCIFRTMLSVSSSLFKSTEGSTNGKEASLKIGSQRRITR